VRLHQARVCRHDAYAEPIGDAFTRHSGRLLGGRIIIRIYRTLIRMYRVPDESDQDWVKRRILIGRRKLCD
jgi:hypothetical protein